VENELETKREHVRGGDGMSKNLSAPQDSKILIYESDSGETRLEVRLQDETVWLTQKLMSELFQKDVRTINEHIKNVYEEGELEPESTIRKFRIVQTEGSRQVRRMRDWEMFLDKFLRDTELSVLADAGSASREQALSWAHDQYDAFAERRRLEAEAEAEKRYVEDLRASAKTLEAERRKLTAPKKSKLRKRKGGK